MKKAAMMLIVFPLLLAGCNMPAAGRTAWPYIIEVDSRAADNPSAAGVSRGVIGPGNYTWDPSLVVQSDGKAVVGYYFRLQYTESGEIGEMRRAVISGGNVTRSTLVSPSGHWSGFTLLPNDSVAFFLQNASNAFYVFDQSGAQQAKSDFSGYYPSFPRAVVSPGGVLTSVMWTGTNNPGENWKLCLATLSGGGWDLPAGDVFVEEPDDPTPWRIEWADGTEPHLAYDNNGDPVVAYEKNNIAFPDGSVEHTNHIFTVARKKLGVWTNTELFTVPEVYHSAGGSDRGPFIAVDRAGTLHLVVYCLNRMFHASKPEGGPWSVEELFLDYGAYNTDVDFALEREAAADIPSILFFSRSNGAAVAQRKNGRWVVESVDSDGHVLNGALTTDANGTLWAVYGLYDPGSRMWYKMIAHK